MTSRGPTPKQSGTPRPTRPDSFPLAYLNHFYVVLDSSTFRAVEQNNFFRNHFAVHEKRTTTNGDITYTGLYFYGVNTYFELFDIAESPARSVGDSGIAFGVDQIGSTKLLQQKFGARPNLSVKPVTRLYDGKQIPWFLMATPATLPYESELSSWVMEYHPEFLAQWNPQSGGENRGIARKDILKRYSEVLEPVEDQYLEDVVGLTVAADELTTSNLMHFCRRLGYQSEGEKSNGVALYGPDLVLQLIPATANVRGIREIKMRTRRGLQTEDEQRIGRSIVRYVGSSAMWSFF